MAASVLVSNLGEWGPCGSDGDEYNLCSDKYFSLLFVLCYRPVRDGSGVSSAHGLRAPWVDILHVFHSFSAGCSICCSVHSGDEGEAA